MTDLTPLLGEPGASVAVIGATDHPTKYGGIIYRDLKRRGTSRLRSQSLPGDG